MRLVAVILAIVFYTILVYCLLIVFITANGPQSESNFLLSSSCNKHQALESADSSSNSAVLALCDNLPLQTLSNWAGRVYLVREAEARRTALSSVNGLSSLTFVTSPVLQLSFLVSKMRMDQIAIVVFSAQALGRAISFTDHLRVLLASLTLEDTSIILPPPIEQQCSWRDQNKKPGAHARSEFSLVSMRAFIIRKTSWLDAFMLLLCQGLPFQEALDKKLASQSRPSSKAVKQRRGTRTLADGFGHVLVSTENFFVDVEPSKLAKSKALLYSLVWQKSVFR
jgi:hypothetical protein